MAKLSDIYNRVKNQINNDGIQTPSGLDDAVITGFTVALGTLLTGETNITDPQTLRSKMGKAKPKGKTIGILGWLEQIDKDINALITIQGKSSEGTSTAAASNINIDGAGFASILNAIKDFNISKETKQSIETLAELTKQNGALTNVFKNFEEYSNLNIDFDKVSSQILGINKTVAEMCAIDGGIDPDKIEATAKLMQPTADLVGSCIGIGLLLVVIGLLSSHIDYVGVLKFSLILLGFLTGIVGVFLLANKLLEPKGDVFIGVEKYAKLVTISGTILIVAGILAKHIDQGALVAFSLILSGFLLGLTAIYKLVINVSGEIQDGLKQFMDMVVRSAAIMFFGSLLVRYIKFGDLLTFTLYLGGFLLGIIGVMWVWNKAVKKVEEGIKDAITAVGLAAFIMFLGAATIHALDIASLLKFTFYLGVFLFGISLVLLVTSKVLEKEMKGVHDAMFLVTATSFIMFLGAATMKHIDKKALTQFIVTLDLFLFGILGIITLFAKKLKDNETFVKALKQVTVFVGLSSFIMLTAGYFLMKYPRLKRGIMQFLTLFGIFLAEVGLFVRFLVGKGGLGLTMGGTIKFDPFALPRTIATMHLLQSFIAVSTVCMVGAGWAISENPHLLWAIPAYMGLLGILLIGVHELLTRINTKKITDKRLLQAKSIMRIIEELLLSTSVSFLLLSQVYKTIEKAGGMDGFAGLVTCVVGTVGALAAVVVYVAKKGGSEKQRKQAMLTMGVISGVLVVTAFAFAKLGDTYEIIEKAGGMGNFAILVTCVVGTLTALGFLTVGLAALLGNGVTTAAAYAAIGVILAVAGAVWIASDAMLNVAESLEKLSNIKEFDATKLMNSVQSVLELAKVMAPMGLMAPLLFAASLSLRQMTKLVSEMAQAVKDYADLKIGIYDGTKLIGYRSLDSSDFEIASYNISLIVSTLTSGIMQAYEEHPEWYGVESFSTFFKMIGNGGKTPLQRVIATSRQLAPLISSIADAVKDYSSLKIKTYTGTKHTGYRQLTTSDFDNAAKNISLIVTTLSKGIMQAYEDHPEWYGTVFGKNFIESLLNSGTPLSRVIKTSKELSPLISSIAKAIKNYVELKIPIYSPGEKEPTSYRTLDNSDFTNAALNIKKVLLTIGNGIMSTYLDHPEWFEEGLIFDSPFMRVVSTNRELSKLISDVASGIKDYANLKIATEWDKNGKAISYRSINDDDFETAAKNISITLLTIGNGIMTTYQEHPEWFEDGWFEDSPFMRVIDVNKDLSKLISKIAESIKDYSKLMIPIEWDKNGKPIKYRELIHDDFVNAANNISTLVVTTAMGLFGYDADGKANSSREFIEKYFIDGDEDDFNAVLDASVKIGETISSLAEGISHFSDMMFPDYSEGIDEHGRPKKGYKELKPSDFRKASECITTVIVTVAEALIKEVNNPNHKNIWEYDDEWETSPLHHILTASEKMGKTISNIARSLSDYANMKFPSEYDTDGKATGYTKLTDGDLKNAASKITDVITLMAKAFVEIYNNDPELWKIRTTKKGGFFGIGGTTVPVEQQSPMERVIDASAKIGKTISSIAIGLQTFAGGNIGDKEHPVIITDETIRLAKSAITDVLTTMAETLADLVNNPATSNLFIFDNVAKKLTTALDQMSKVVMNSAQATQLIASLKIPVKWDATGKAVDWRSMTESDFTKAKGNIKKIVTAIGTSFNEVMNDANNGWLKDIDDSSFAGLRNFAADIFGGNKTRSSSTIATVMKSIMTMAMTLSIMSGCIYGYATMRFPIGVDEKGNVKYSDPLSYKEIEDAKSHIKHIILSMGDAMMSVVDNATFKSLTSDDDNADITKIVNFVSDGTKAVISISSAVRSMLDDENIKALPNIIKRMSSINEEISSIISELGSLMQLIFGGDERYGTHISNINEFAVSGESVQVNSFADIVKYYGDKYENLEPSLLSINNIIRGIIGTFADISKTVQDTKIYIKDLEKIFIQDDYVLTVRNIINGIGNLLSVFGHINSFDALIKGENYMSNIVGSNEVAALTEHDMSMIVEKIKVYSSFINDIVSYLNEINVNVSKVGNNNFDSLINGIIQINSSLQVIDIKSLALFKNQNTQLEKFVRTINSVKLLNLTNLNKFVTSMNELAKRMGNLDKLTDAIANKLSKVLEKLVERLVHAENTIVKADEIQKRRHELIKKSVEEVSNLMKQPMTVEIQQVGGETTEEPLTTTDQNNTTTT